MHFHPIHLIAPKTSYPENPGSFPLPITTLPTHSSFFASINLIHQAKLRKIYTHLSERIGFKTYEPNS